MSTSYRSITSIVIASIISFVLVPISACYRKMIASIAADSGVIVTSMPANLHSEKASIVKCRSHVNAIPLNMVNGCERAIMHACESMRKCVNGSDVPCLASSPSCYGGYPNDEFDDWAAIQCALCNSSSIGTAVSLKGGRWITSKSIYVPNVFSGISSNVRTGGTLIEYRGNSNSESVIRSANNAVSISDLAVSGNGKARLGIHVYKCHFRNCSIRRVVVTKTSEIGVFSEYSMVASFSDVSAMRNLGEGIVFQDANGTVANSISATENEGNGIVVRGKSSSTQMTLIGLHSESNGGHGVLISNATAPVTIIGGHIEMNRRDGVRVENSVSAAIDGFAIVGARDTQGVYRAIHCINSHGFVASRCVLGDSKGNSGRSWTSTFARVTLQNCIQNSVRNVRYAHTKQEVPVEDMK